MKDDDAHTQRAAPPILPALPSPTLLLPLTPTLALTLYSILPLSFILILPLHFPPGFAHFPYLHLSFWELLSLYASLCHFFSFPSPLMNILAL